MQKPWKVVNAFGLRSWYFFKICGKAFHVSGSRLTLLYFWVSLLLIKSLRIHRKFLLIPSQGCLRKEKWMAAVTYCCLFSSFWSTRKLKAPALSVGDVDLRHPFRDLCVVYLVLPLPLEDSLHTQYVNINFLTCLNSSLKLLGRVQQSSHLVRCRL